MELVDSHCHLEVFVKNGQFAQVLDDAQSAGVVQMITVGTCPGDWPVYHELALKYPGRIYWTAGLHPSDVEADWQDALAGLSGQWKKNPQPVAVGEIGLDHFRLPKEPEAAQAVKQYQRDAFAQQLDLANELECPVVVHSRAAFRECVEVVDAAGFPWERVVFHCFVDDAEAMAILNERGGVGSFTGITTFKKSEAVVQAMLGQGIERLMLETDSPYLAPVPYRGKQNQPAYLGHVAGFCAEAFAMSVEELATKTTANARAFYGL